MKINEDTSHQVFIKLSQRNPINEKEEKQRKEGHFGIAKVQKYRSKEDNSIDRVLRATKNGNVKTETKKMERVGKMKVILGTLGGDTFCHPWGRKQEK